MNPVEGNPFRSRADAQRAVLDLFERLVPAYEMGGARVSLGSTATGYSRAVAELEAFARPLWGVVPLAAGGVPFAHWDHFRLGLALGTDPGHPQYWGAIGDTHGQPAMADQRMVEMAPIGLALALAPEHLFDPLSADERRQVLAWLEPINRTPIVKNNWQFFRVLVNLGFARVGGPFNRVAVDEALDEIERHWLGDGWYQDGMTGNTDFYIAWAYHFYGLIYAVLAADMDPTRSARFRERARRFAADWEARFDASGRIVAYGRSLTYRFGGAAFWGALAFADEEALPWGQVRGLWSNHLRWWTAQSIGRPDGVLSIGWAYENLLMSETYNGPGSPYWALKAFLPLALPADHPFWSTPEEATGREACQSIQRPAVVVVNRDEQQAQMLNGGRGRWFVRHGPAKYGKLAYSSAFGFGLEPDAPFYQDTAESSLVLRDPVDGVRRVRSAVSDSGIEGDVAWSKWQPFPDVEVVTVLCGEAPWHARVHHIRTGRALETIEGGFAVGVDDDPTGPGSTREAVGAVARVETERAISVIVDADGSRAAAVQDLQPNTNMQFSRSAAPVLSGRLTVGTHVLACVVAAVEAPAELTTDGLPAVPERALQVLRSLTGEDIHTATAASSELPPHA